MSSGRFKVLLQGKSLPKRPPNGQHACQAKGGCEQFIVMSSAGVYGPTDVLPLNESTPGDPKSRHKDKLACENFLAQEGLNWTSIRPVYIYGPLTLAL